MFERVEEVSRERGCVCCESKGKIENQRGIASFFANKQKQSLFGKFRTSPPSINDLEMFGIERRLEIARI